MKDELEKLKEVSRQMGRSEALMEVGNIVFKFLENPNIKDKSTLNELANELMKLT